MKKCNLKIDELEYLEITSPDDLEGVWNIFDIWQDSKNINYGGFHYPCSKEIDSFLKKWLSFDIGDILVRFKNGEIKVYDKKSFDDLFNIVQ